MRSKVIKKDGCLYFDVDGTIIDSLAMKTFRPTRKNIKEFYDAGVRLFHIYVSGLPSGLKFLILYLVSLGLVIINIILKLLINKLNFLKNVHQADIILLTFIWILVLGG